MRSTPPPPAPIPERWPLATWLERTALPWWGRHGVDWAQGGFFERFSGAGTALDEPRRTRVVTRQIYVFATAAQRGLLPQAVDIVEHGLAFLMSRLRKADGSFAASVSTGDDIERSPFHLYEQAFVLFGLAKAHALNPSKHAGLQGVALDLLARLRSGFAHPQGGFEESRPRTLPLLSNPHMHLFEAALAWLQQAPGPDSPWRRLAEELFLLCDHHLVDPATGQIPELFDGGWRAVPAQAGQRIEPGHQFEWAWLLIQWARQGGGTAPLRIARRLIEGAQRTGCDAARQVALNSLDPAGKPLDRAARLWPQTERLKACCAALPFSRSAAEQSSVRAAIAEAHDGLMQYLVNDIPGLWREVMQADGTWAAEPTRASSLYHIVSAYEALDGIPVPGAAQPVPQNAGLRPAAQGTPPLMDPQGRST